MGCQKLLQLHELKHLSLGLPKQVAVDHLSTFQFLKVHVSIIAGLSGKASLLVLLQVLPRLPLQLQTSCNTNALNLLLAPPIWAITR
jgi:hypothetical protein